MPRTLLVTNDFPPRIGGIQSYLRDFVHRLEPDLVMVFASTERADEARKWDAEAPYAVERVPQGVLLPTPGVRRRMCEIIRAHNIETVWFGAAAPLAVMGEAAKKAGARQVIASTHGHEVGWSMFPGSRHILRRIGDSADIVTYISGYTLGRIGPAFGKHPTFVTMSSGVDIEEFSPSSSTEKKALREIYGYREDELLIVCVSRLVPRKGQDMLIKAMPAVLREAPNARLVIVGGGSYRRTLEGLRRTYAPNNVDLVGSCEASQVRDYHKIADIFAMPARTRGKGLDVEGLGIVYLEAQACGVPVIAGDSGGAPETVTDETAIVVRGHSQEELELALLKLVRDEELRRRMGQAGRLHVERHWSWEKRAQTLRSLLG